MAKPISQRGFNVTRGDNFGKPGRAMVSYEIDNKGLENILLVRGMIEWRVWMTLDDGEIKVLEYQSSQMSCRRITENFGDHKEGLGQALEIYKEVKKILNVEEELKDYLPRFSCESELSLYNIMGIDDASQIKSLIEDD